MQYPQQSPEQGCVHRLYGNRWQCNDDIVNPQVTLMGGKCTYHSSILDKLLLARCTCFALRQSRRSITTNLFLKFLSEIKTCFYWRLILHTMLEISQFIFSNFWIWAGTVILIIYLGEAITSIADSVFKGVISLKNINKKG